MTIRTGYGPHGVQDPPCLERLRVGFFTGCLYGMPSGLIFFTIAECTSHEELFKPSLSRKPSEIYLAKRIQRIGARTARLTLAFGLFMVAGSAIKCT